MNELPFTATGNLTRDPEIRFTADGKAVASLAIAVTPRRYDQVSRRWVDGTPTYVELTVWGAQAEHAAESLQQGDRVIAVGRWVTRTFVPQSGANAGQEVHRLEVVVDELGPSLRWATARPMKAADKPNLHAVSDEPPF